jgi:ABC-type polysaccharide/polyol phosphate export permease
MVEPAQTIAKYNPLSFVVEGIREPIIAGLKGSDTLDAVLAIAGIAVFSGLLSARALQRRLMTGA